MGSQLSRTAVDVLPVYRLGGPEARCPTALSAADCERCRMRNNNLWKALMMCSLAIRADAVQLIRAESVCGHDDAITWSGCLSSNCSA